LGVLAGLPQDLAVPGLDRARAKAMPAPAAVPSGGRSVKVLGRAQVGGHAVGLSMVDSRQHVHLIGKTGVGKSTLLLNMIMSDVHAGRGVVVIDPRGDLVLDVLDRLPAGCADRLAIIDPDQPNPAHFNPLDDGGDAHLAVDNLVGVFAKIFQRHWGPRMDDTLRVTCLTLMRQPQPTLALVPPLLNDRGWRARFTHDLSDPEGLGGFWTWYDSMNEAQRSVVIGPVLARLRQFLLRDFVKDVIGTAHTSLRMPQILDGGILLCRLPKGMLGEETVRILGSLIVARTWQAAIGRAAQPEQQRRDATLYVDEAHNFLNLPGSVEDMLAEARGFRLGLVLAHQNLAQLPRETADAVSANARTKIVFNVDPADAKELAKHTQPELDAHDLAHLDVYTAAGRLLVGNRELPAFTFTTNRPGPVLGHTRQIRARHAQLHARDAGDPPPRRRKA
ncbi:type IV secretory system conjugative DNA transfer family protein, partial [Actinoplanes xinjiangensis]|uniref:type IV secretory system conjugative DNA transfer family protein n=1 Tax=Actinoplanes xinjiangensis TaxID=512350 RepID=UPI0034324D31